MRHIWYFLAVVLVVWFINSLRYASFDQNRATGHMANVAHMKENLIDAAKLYAVAALVVLAFK